MTNSASTPTDALSTFAAERVHQVCELCGTTDITMEAAVRWDAAAQEWRVSTVYDKSGHCDACDADVRVKARVLEQGESLPTFTVFVRQADGRGTTHVSTHQAASQDDAEQLGLAETAANWDYSEQQLAVLGVIAGDVQLLSWDGAPCA